MQEVKEQIAEVILKGGRTMELAEDILNLRYECKECEGSGKVPFQRGINDTPVYISRITCPVCKGTGKGLPMLAILDSDQSLPVNPYNKNTMRDIIRHEAIKTHIEIMLSQGWKKVKEVKE